MFSMIVSFIIKLIFIEMVMKPLRLVNQLEDFSSILYFNVIFDILGLTTENAVNYYA